MGGSDPDAEGALLAGVRPAGRPDVGDVEGACSEQLRHRLPSGLELGVADRDGVETSAFAPLSAGAKTRRRQAAGPLTSRGTS
jgi:hypothetical protein